MQTAIRLLATILWVAVSTVSLAGEPSIASAPVSPKMLREYRSQHLVVHTDLPEEAAKAAIENLERTLSQAAKYWGHDPRGQIQCYLLDQVHALPDGDLPHRLTRVFIDGVGGVTLPNLARSGKNVRNHPTILASTRPGIAEHELVHAYCTQTFGFTGPGWYSEGMAEMVVQRSTRESGIRCSADQIQILRNSHQVSIDEILAGGQSAGRIMESLNKMLADPKNQHRQIPLSDWQQHDRDNLATAREEYLRSWALCYLLLHNPNYGPRFRTLGKQYVTTQNCEFANVFPAMKNEIAFEYAFFLKNICSGFRVDLCRWDWGKRFRPIESGGSSTVRIEAKQGYQASGVCVTQGARYRIELTGNWSGQPVTEGCTAEDQRALDRPLCGVILKEYGLCEPFTLSADEVFRAPVSGNLYLRCQDEWGQLHDNQGYKIVRLRPVE